MDRPAAGPRARIAFALTAGVYYLVYLAVFSLRVADYWKAVLRHFPWVRSWLG